MGTLVFGPVTVCGLSLAPVPTQGQPAVTITAQKDVTAKLVQADVDVGGGVRMSGAISLRYAPECRRVFVDGTLAAPSEQYGLHFAARRALMLDESNREPIVRGTLARPEVVDGLTLVGDAIVRVASNGDVHVLDGWLAKLARFEDWNVPAATHVQRSANTWRFTTTKGTSARAAAAHHGEWVDDVTEAWFDVNGTGLTLARPHLVTGTTLACTNMLIDPTNGCVVGSFGSPQSFGIFRFPADSRATVCKGAVVEANSGASGVPSVQVGTWFATHAIAGARRSAPPSLLSPAVPKADPPTGYWIQIHSLCGDYGGEPTPPPPSPERWIWVDVKGVAASAADQSVLTKEAAKPGKACPVTECCPP
jgi:hypothetical protein